jgi:hypothetical protein
VPQGQGQDPSRRRRRHPQRRAFIALFSLLALLVVLVIADRASAAIAENDAASQIQSAGFPARPSVSIKGFPFLTQVAAHDIGQVDISAGNVAAGPVEITSLNATATGVHLDSGFKTGVIDHISGSALVTFQSLAGAGSGGSGGGAGLSMAEAGPDTVKITAGPVSEDARVTVSGNTVRVQVINNGDLISGLLSSFGDISFTVPKLPAGMTVTGVSVTQQGLRISAAAQHTQFSQ